MFFWELTTICDIKIHRMKGYLCSLGGTDSTTALWWIKTLWRLKPCVVPAWVIPQIGNYMKQCSVWNPEISPPCWGYHHPEALRSWFIIVYSSTHLSLLLITSLIRLVTLVFVDNSVGDSARDRLTGFASRGRRPPARLLDWNWGLEFMQIVFLMNHFHTPGLWACELDELIFTGKCWVMSKRV